MRAMAIIALGLLLTAIPFWIGPHVRDYWRAARTPEHEER